MDNLRIQKIIHFPFSIIFRHRLFHTVSNNDANGANDIYACFTHAVLSGNAIQNLRGSHLKKIIVTNTIPLGDKGEILREESRIEVLSVAKLLASGIKSIHDETSVSTLFI
ncbi:MAG: hypothetical protein M3T96_09200 [Acidobacteriota bacterium]|nr:hypothetical protein [Acidobacteriota bacterium]